MTKNASVSKTMPDNNHYSIRVHDRQTENDPEVATVMYTNASFEGPWFDMVQGHPDWCEEVLDALIYRKNHRQDKTDYYAYAQTLEQETASKEDIVARVRDACFVGSMPTEKAELFLASADEIEDLRYKITKMKSLLQDVLREAYRG